MASTIAAITTSGGGVVTTADATGNLNLLAGTTTVVALTTAGAAVSGTLSATGVVTSAASFGSIAAGGTGANAYFIDNNTGTGANPVRIRSLGPDASTIGGFKFEGAKSDNSSITALATFAGTGAVTIPGTLAAGATTVTGTLSATGNLTSLTAQFGTNPAGVSVGIIGIPNQKRIYGRNAANTADVNILYVDASNNVVFGPSDMASFSSTGLAVTGTISASAASAAFTGLQVGTANGVNSGFIIGNKSSGTGAIWSTSITPSATNYALHSDGGQVGINAATSATLNVANSVIASATSTGLAVTGVLTTSTSSINTIATLTSTHANGGYVIIQGTGSNSTPLAYLGRNAALGIPGSASDFVMMTGSGIGMQLATNGGQPAITITASVTPAVAIPGTLAFGSGTTGSVGSWTSSTGGSKIGFFYADATYAAISTGSALTGQGMVLSATHAGFMVANSGVFTATAGSGSTSGIRLDAYTTNGTVTTTGGTGVLSSASDATLKTHDGFVENPLNMLAGLKARYYFWNHELGKEEPAQRQLGFFAQDVNEHLGDEAANPPKGDAKWGYYDRSVLAVAVEAINALAADFEAYKQSHP